MRHLTRALVVACGALTLLATGCGGDDDGGAGDQPTAADAPDDTADDTTASAPAAPACGLTAEDVSAALGEAMVQAGGPCTFEPAEFPDTGPFLDYRPSPPAVVSQLGAGGSAPVQGLGDEAFFDEGSGNLAVRQGDLAFQIQLNEHDGDVRATVVGLAEVVLAAG